MFKIVCVIGGAIAGIALGWNNGGLVGAIAGAVVGGFLGLGAAWVFHPLCTLSSGSFYAPY